MTLLLAIVAVRILMQVIGFNEAVTSPDDSLSVFNHNDVPIIYRKILK